MVTWHALGAIALIIIGIVVAVFGALEALAGGMSDAPAAGDAMGRSGCITLLVGLAMVAVAVVMMVRG